MTSLTLIVSSKVLPPTIVILGLRMYTHECGGWHSSVHNRATHSLILIASDLMSPHNGTGKQTPGLGQQENKDCISWPRFNNTQTECSPSEKPFDRLLRVLKNETIKTAHKTLF